MCSALHSYWYKNVSSDSSWLRSKGALWSFCFKKTVHFLSFLFFFTTHLMDICQNIWHGHCFIEHDLYQIRCSSYLGSERVNVNSNLIGILVVSPLFFCAAGKNELFHLDAFSICLSQMSQWPSLSFMLFLHLKYLLQFLLVIFMETQTTLCNRAELHVLLERGRTWCLSSQHCNTVK